MSGVVIKVVSAGFCKNCGPYKEALKQEGIEFESVDADDDSNIEFLTKNAVRSLPTSLVFEDGKLIGRVVGNKVNELKEILK